MERATIDEVAADAGFTKGAFYANFKSKQELFLAMLDERFAARLAKVREYSAGQSTNGRSEVITLARAAGEDFARYLASDPDWQRLLFEFTLHAARDEPFRRELVGRYRDLRTGVTEVFAEHARQLGVRSPVELSQLTMMIFTMTNGFALERLLEPDAATEDLYATMLTIFFTGLTTLAQRSSTPNRKEHPQT